MSAVVRLLAAVVLAAGLLGLPVGPTAPDPVAAATPDLTIVGKARYDVQPSDRRVRVIVDLTLRNRLKDTATRRYYFDEAFLAVPALASSFSLTWDGAGDPSVSVSRRTEDAAIVRLRLGARLFSGKTASYRLTFYLKDPGGEPTRDLRVGEALVSFPVWAYASDDTPGASTTVVFPPGYQVSVEAGSIPPPETDDTGRTIFRSGTLERPLDFFAYLVADRPASFDETTIAPVVLGQPAEVVVRAWPDDPDWAERVGALVEGALPVLGRRIGLPWAHEDPLIVEEARSRTTGGYAGLFDPSGGRVEIAYYASDLVVLHEAAHAWFNGALLADRWANEAFASYYAVAVAADLDVPVTPDTLTDDPPGETQVDPIPLNDWGPVGSVDAAAEDTAYAAAYDLATLIVERAGEEHLRRVWAWAAAGVGAYQPAGGGVESVEGAPDWRGLLDLLEERSEARFDDLWRAWVARPSDVPLLDARREARSRYEAVTALAGEWQLPRQVRDALRAWRFDEAVALLDEAAPILAGRETLAEAAAAAGLVPPPTLESAFEDDDGFDDAALELSSQLEVLDRYRQARTLRPLEPTPIEALGLWGTTPDASLDAAAAAYRRGDLRAAAVEADTAAAIWSDAERVGTGRLVSLILLALAAIIAITMLVRSLRRRGRRRRMARPLER
ncbi:MAG: hypothetical protein ACLGIJ_09780 [Candidatus Limnocylindria bacterium]